MDAAAIAAVRAHLRQIADAFAEGDFAKPFATHGEVPPGTAAMTKRRADIAYQYEEQESGAAVILTTNNRTALKAIHDFLRYQIVEHKTGDALTVPR